MARNLSLFFAWVFILVGIAGAITGVVRITDGETMRGLADIIIGGLVACYGEGNRRDAQ